MTSLGRPAPLSADEELLGSLFLFRNDPLGFVLYAFPWGEPGTELADRDGPEAWQADILQAIGDGTLRIDQAVQIAVASGHGIGKSALVAWIILWAIATFPGTRGVVTANTENQLKTKTWAEVGKWHRLFIGRELFELTATALITKDKTQVREWRIDMVPWSEKNTEAFAGLHNLGKRQIMLFDEGSAIPGIIWEVTRGFLTDAGTEIIWAVFGNPTKNSGEFYNVFHPAGTAESPWLRRQIDSRTVRHTNKKQYALWEKEWGEDSDFFRVRVRGLFPRQGMNEFISGELVREAMARDPDELGMLPDEPVVLGVDVARYGDDASVIYPRRGRDAASLPYRQFQGISTMTLVDEILRAMQDYRTRLVAVDEGGVGGGVVDRLKQLGVDVIPVDFGAKSYPRAGREVARYANKRAEIWGSMRDWLRGGALPLDPQLLTELTAPLYTINLQEAIQLERKDAMKARGASSPNIADALAITFAVDTSFVEYDDLLGQVQGITHDPFGGVRTFV